MFKGSVSGVRHRELFRAICSDPSLEGVPSWVTLSDGDEIPATPDWRNQCLRHGDECAAFWKDADYNTLAGFSYLPRSELVLFTLPRPRTEAEQRAALERLPFELAALTSPCWSEWVATKKQRWGFARTHVDHGWACAFRGSGHDRLVSRRWLDFGPWRVVRLPDDTTFIQFHDLAITDPEEAYAQAAPGHQRMGIDPSGGFIQGIDPEVLDEVGGVFIPSTRTLEIPIAPRIEVTQQDMLMACAVRLYHKLHVPASKRIERIAYVFIDRRDAEAHLHELWLREIECWYMDESGRHRIDADYHPTPNPPAWVKALEQR